MFPVEWNFYLTMCWNNVCWWMLTRAIESLLYTWNKHNSDNVKCQLYPKIKNKKNPKPLKNFTRLMTVRIFHTLDSGSLIPRHLSSSAGYFQCWCSWRIRHHSKALSPLLSCNKASLLLRCMSSTSYLCSKE